MTDSSISPCLINEVDSVYHSVLWFRLALMDLGSSHQNALPPIPNKIEPDKD